MEKVLQGSGHSRELPELTGSLDTSLRNTVWISGGTAWSSKLDYRITAHPFQLGIFCGVILAG